MNRQMSEEEARAKLLVACKELSNALEHYDEIIRNEQKWKDLAKLGSVQTRKARVLQNKGRF